MRGIHRSQGPVTRSFDSFSLIRAWTNGRSNNRDAGELIRYHAHHDVTVMSHRTLTPIIGTRRNIYINISIWRAFVTRKKHMLISWAIRPDSKVHGANVGHIWATGPRWAPCWPHQPCYLGGHKYHDLTMMKGWGFLSVPAIIWIIVESYDYKHVDMGSSCGTSFKHSPDAGLVLVRYDHITPSERHW